ncbi:NAD(P)-dependent oxidoreductase [Vagococcus martis]|uniref:NAD(P)-dependent oxidoreductase n=1 Tax=Vagococcus martis TaxID=1768210 RepID=A0A1V4DGL6_9ENTE|nr:SDR family oxidoreductase [Vagococcus martis]OPF87635.1 NAD(P)-dependent oxidoreductase [Vagococcus martis]
MEHKLNKPKEDYHQQDGSDYLSTEVLIEDPNYLSANKLKGKRAIITGGDSGIGAAIAIAYAHEGADLGIVYYENDADAFQVKKRAEELGSTVYLFKGDVGYEHVVKEAVDFFIEQFETIDILVNNVAEQHERDSIVDITEEEVQREFATNIYSFMYFTKYLFPHFNEGASIINNASVNAYRGHPYLLTYSTTKSAVIGYTRSLSVRDEFIAKKIRVNSVAPGPIWTPLIPATMKGMTHDKFGLDTPMKRCGEAYEVAPCFVFLASNQDSSYISGQCLHVNGGAVLNG